MLKYFFKCLKVNFNFNKYYNIILEVSEYYSLREYAILSCEHSSYFSIYHDCPQGICRFMYLFIKIAVHFLYIELGYCIWYNLFIRSYGNF